MASCLASFFRALTAPLNSFEYCFFKDFKGSLRVLEEDGSRVRTGVNKGRVRCFKMMLAWYVSGGKGAGEGDKGRRKTSAMIERQEKLAATAFCINLALREATKLKLLMASTWKRMVMRSRDLSKSTRWWSSSLEGLTGCEARKCKISG